MPKPRPKLKCPSCGHRFSMVTDSRDEPVPHGQQLHWRGDGVWRERQCVQCQHRYTTREYIWPYHEKSSTTPIS